MRPLTKHRHSSDTVPNREGFVVRVLKIDKRRDVLHLLIEGNSIRSTERLTGVHRDTITRLLVGTGNRANEFLDCIGCEI